MSELRDLYQEVILDHSRRPRNFRTVATPTHEAQGTNPLCGDRLSLYLTVEGDVVRDVAFQGSGCAISTASTSMMTEALKGKTIAEARTMLAEFHTLLTGNDASAPTEKLGKLTVFSGVREFPVRVKCATLPWHTLKAALDRSDRPASTE